MRHLALSALFALSLAACGRNPLTVPGDIEAGPSDPTPPAGVATETETTDAPLPTATAVDTATQTTSSVPTMTPEDCVKSGCDWMDDQCICIIGTETATATATSAPTNTATQTSTATSTTSATATPTSTTTMTVTNTTTATVVAPSFHIVSAVAEAVDSYRNAAPDVRSFGITLSSQAAWVNVSIYEKQTNALFYGESLNDGPLATSLYLSPGNWTKGLAPNTAYTWVVTATPYIPEPESHGPAAYTGEFTTGSFDAGEISVSFTTAVHAAGYVDAVPGQKDIWMGTVAVKNSTPHTVGLNGMGFGFNAWTPSVQDGQYVDGSVGDYLTNCRVTGWPNTEAFGAPFTPSYVTTLNFSRVLKKQESQLFDVTCDATAKQPKRTTKIALEAVDQIPQTTCFGKVRVGETNGNPPQVYVLLVGKEELASAEPLPLFVRLSDDQNYPRIVTGNTRDNTIARLEFYGANEKVSLTRLSFADYGDNGADVESFRIFDASMTLFCSGALNASNTLDCANDAGLLTVSGVTPITIKANINQVSSSGERWMAVSGDRLSGQLIVIRAATDSSKDGWFRAVGASGRQYRLTYSGDTPDSSGFAIGGAEITVRKSQPTIATIALSESERRLSNGYGRTMFKFSVTADNNADVSFKRFTLVRSLKGVSTDMYYVYENGVISSSWFMKLDARGDLVFDYSAERVASAGTSRVIEVKADISGAAAGSFISHRLAGDDAQSQNFLWSDNSADVVHSLTSSDWWNGYQVKGLPTIDQVVSLLHLQSSFRRASLQNLLAVPTRFMNS